MGTGETFFLVEAGKALRHTLGRSSSATSPAADALQHGRWQGGGGEGGEGFFLVALFHLVVFRVEVAAGVIRLADGVFVMRVNVPVEDILHCLEGAEVRFLRL